MQFQLRITPAPAGKTARRVSKYCSSWDHPRTCGENVYWVDFDFNSGGSPPHLRGKQWVESYLSADRRITPAPAGKTHVKEVLCSAPWDHPRTCGENLNTLSLLAQLKRITPAPAGKTRRKCKASNRYEDHPRTCGENTKK